jgi:hypothetical protein
VSLGRKRSASPNTVHRHRALLQMAFGMLLAIACSGPSNLGQVPSKSSSGGGGSSGGDGGGGSSGGGSSRDGSSGGIAAGSCSDFFDLTNTPPACTPNAGARANGSACVNNGQCQSTWCYAPATTACGTCATRPAVGATCAADVDCGGQGMLCSTANTCAMIVAMGGTCDNSHPCGFALSCVSPTVTQSGTCQAAGATVGAACDGSKMMAPLCEHDFGLFCPSATEMCAQASLVGTSQACGVMPGVKTDAGVGPSSMATCNGGGACEPSTVTKGACTAPASDGAACDNVLGPPCLAPARCVTTSDASTAGTCAILEQTMCN